MTLAQECKPDIVRKFLSACHDEDTGWLLTYCSHVQHHSDFVAVTTFHILVFWKQRIGCPDDEKHLHITYIQHCKVT